VARDWLLLAAFAALLGAASSLVAVGFHDVFFVQVLGLLLASASHVALIEFGRRQVACPAEYERYRTPYLYLSLAGIAGLFAAVGGWHGFDLASRFVLGLPSAALAAAVFAQRARTSKRWEPSLAAAAVGFLGLGYALSVGPLVAFAALGLVGALWCERRRQLPIESTTGIVKKWRSPALFLLIAIAGSSIVALRTEQTTHPVLVVADGAGGGQAADNSLEPVNIDARQLARDDAAARRMRQAVIFLTVVIVLGGAWGGVSYYTSRRN
jgi:hypothetical protein